jgi:hypothetical protein
MSLSSDIPLTYSQYSIQNHEDFDNDLVDENREIKPSIDFKVIPPIQPLGNLYTNFNLNYNKQDSIDVFNTSTDVICTSKFNPENKDKQQVVFETDEKNNYIVMLDENKHKEIVVEKNEEVDYQPMKFTRDKPLNNNNMVTTFYIASVTVVGLFIVYRMIQKSR